MRRPAALLFAALVTAAPTAAMASTDPSTTLPAIDEQSGVTVPITVSTPTTVPSVTTTVPVGCAPAPLSQAVFVGRVVTVDATTSLFEVVRLRSGSLAGYSTETPRTDGRVVTEAGIYYGRDVKFLDVGATYLVGTALDATTGRIYSRVSESAPLFGGNQVADINNSGVVCPTFADVARTLNTDGSSIESGVLSGLKGESGRLALALIVPIGLVLLGLVTLVLVKPLITT